MNGWIMVCVDADIQSIVQLIVADMIRHLRCEVVVAHMAGAMVGSKRMWRC